MSRMNGDFGIVRIAQLYVFATSRPAVLWGNGQGEYHE